MIKKKILCGAAAIPAGRWAERKNDMCNELQEQLQRQQQQILQEQQQVQRRKQAGPEQPQQLEESRTEQKERQIAAHIQSAFPPAGAQEPPEEPAAPMQQEQAASESKIARSRRKKREKKAERRRQEEEQRRKAEERERAQQEEQKENQRQHDLLMKDDEFLTALNTFAQDQTEANAELVLRTASRRLVALVPNVADRFEATADLRTTFPSYRMAIAAQVEDDDVAAALLKEFDKHEDAMAKLSEERIPVALSSLDLPVLLEAEFKASDLFQKAANRLSEQYGNKMDYERKQVNDLEFILQRNVGMSTQASQNLFSSDGPFSLYKKEETMSSYRESKQKIMADTHCTEREAEQRLLAQIREENKQKRQEAALLSRQASVVKNISEQVVKEYGMASFHQILTQEQAKMVVMSSRGLLFDKPVEGHPGLAELRPTLPETVEETNAEGKTRHVVLRKPYQQFMKVIAASLIGADGVLKTNAGETMEKLLYFFSDHSMVEKFEPFREDARNMLDDTFDAALKELYPEEKQREEVKRGIADMFPYLEHRDKAGGYYASGVFNAEALGSVLNGFVSSVKKLYPGTEGQTKEEARAVRLQEEREKMQGKDQQEIDERLHAIGKMFDDADEALEELRKIRELNEDNPEIPLINACSANAQAYNAFGSTFLDDTRRQLAFSIRSHETRYPNRCLSFLRKKYTPENGHPEPGSQDEKILRDITDMEQKFRGYEELSEEERLKMQDTYKNEFDQLHDLLKPFVKYDYHEAGNAGTMGDGTAITVEAFAAETTQFVVSPLTTHSAVGLYRQGQKGMIGYYQEDNPLPSDAEMESYIKTKQDLSGNRV